MTTLPPEIAPRLAAALAEGRTNEVPLLLGRYWTVTAPVEHGDKRGRTMGFPTANMHLEETPLAFGIYAVRVLVPNSGDVWIDGVANYGIRPMYRIVRPLMEVHLFDFDGDLYGKELTVELVAWLRPEASFKGLEALIAQIAADAAHARQILAQAAHHRGPSRIDNGDNGLQRQLA
jgi:riboflavin kinase/FMN adenylyltransferase